MVSSAQKKQQRIRRQDTVRGRAIGVGAPVDSAPPEKNATSKPWLPLKWDYEADVVVVGYGGAGASAAISAHDAGARVLILEKASVSGGNTGCAGGGMVMPDDVANAIEYYRALARGTADDELVRALAEAMVELPHILEKWGAKLEFNPRHTARVNDPNHPGSIVSGGHFPHLPGSIGFSKRACLARTAQQVEEGIGWTQGSHLFDFFRNQVENREIRVMYETPVKELIQDFMTKAILGVEAEDLRGEILVKARRGVVLACGGFENHKEMLLNFLPYMTDIPIHPWGTPYNTGDGILMASKVGAKLWHMNGVELGVFAPKTPSDEFGVAFGLLNQLPTGSRVIYVNKYGKRFMSESMVSGHRRDLPKVQYFDHERAEYPNIPFYMIFDEAHRKKGRIVETRYGWWCTQNLYEWSDDNSAEIELGWIVKGNTIKELGEKIGLDSVALEETVSKYNEYCMKGEDPEFGRSKEWLVPIATPPYYATELCQPIINTQGGPKHNARAQVLDNNDKPIPRLYAAGELGSFFGPMYEGGSNIPEAFAFGRIAGEHAAGQTPWE